MLLYAVDAANVYRNYEGAARPIIKFLPQAEEAYVWTEIACTACVHPRVIRTGPSLPDGTL